MLERRRAQQHRVPGPSCNSVFRDNKAVGNGANPARAGTRAAAAAARLQRRGHANYAAGSPGRSSSERGARRGRRGLLREQHHSGAWRIENSVLCARTRTTSPRWRDHGHLLPRPPPRPPSSSAAADGLTTHPPTARPLVDGDASQPCVGRGERHESEPPVGAGRGLAQPKVSGSGAALERFPWPRVRGRRRRLGPAAAAVHRPGSGDVVVHVLVVGVASPSAASSCERNRRPGDRWPGRSPSAGRARAGSDHVGVDQDPAARANASSPELAERHQRQPPQAGPSARPGGGDGRR